MIAADTPHELATISTHAPRTGSDYAYRFHRLKDGISTHAPRTGSDTSPRRCENPHVDFNPRSPHGERPVAHRLGHSSPISTHAPRTGSDGRGRRSRRRGEISTHAPRTGSDGALAERLPGLLTFQPTLPARGATGWCWHDFRRKEISTHAPRTGSDPAGSLLRKAPLNFNPRSPHGERRLRRAGVLLGDYHFNPRSPHGERPNAKGEYYNIF